MMTVETADELADLRVLPLDQTAALLGVHPNTLKNLRRRNAGPRVTVLSDGRIGYRIKDIREWLDSCAENPEVHVTDNGATPTAAQRTAAQRDIIAFIDALAHGDLAAADALIPATAANVVALEAAGLVIRALQLAEDPEAAFHALREAVLRE
jgi:hypothetical protein